VTHPAFERLKERLAEVHDLTKAATLLAWDERVMMPPGGSAARAEALGTASRLAQERFIAGGIGELLDDLRSLELRPRYVQCFDPPDETYDVLLDDYEPNMKTAEIARDLRRP
jgi:Zn-dependent M32 family carboxypeptidase